MGSKFVLWRKYIVAGFTGLKMRRDNTALLLYKKTQFQSRLYFPDVLKFLLNSVLHKNA